MVKSWSFCNMHAQNDDIHGAKFVWLHSQGALLTCLATDCQQPHEVLCLLAKTHTILAAAASAGMDALSSARLAFCRKFSQSSLISCRRLPCDKYEYLRSIKAATYCSSTALRPASKCASAASLKARGNTCGTGSCTCRRDHHMRVQRAHLSTGISNWLFHAATLYIIACFDAPSTLQSQE